MRGAHQYEQARKTGDDSDQDTERGTMSARPQPVYEDHPERDSCYQQGGNARGHGLLRPANASVARKEQQGARNGGSDPLLLCRPLMPLPEQKAEQDAGADMPRSSQKQRREGLEPDANREIGAAPDHIDGQKTGRDQEGIFGGPA